MIWSKLVRVIVNFLVFMFYLDSNKLVIKFVLMVIDVIIVDLFDYGNM